VPEALRSAKIIAAQCVIAIAATSQLLSPSSSTDCAYTAACHCCSVCNRPAEIWEQVRTTAVPALTSSWRFWPLIHCVSFSNVIPKDLKLLFIDFMVSEPYHAQCLLCVRTDHMPECTVRIAAYAYMLHCETTCATLLCKHVLIAYALCGYCTMWYVH
jgi:Mpv17 / PMP22 family